jgi:NAD(P)H-dependent FMN reductase
MTAAAPLKLLGISGSLRAQSYNTGALRAVGALVPDHITFTVASLAPLPFYSADVEQRGFPPTVDGFRKEVSAADALIFAVPESNYSVCGVLKNALEWLSRPPNPPATGRPCAMFGVVRKSAGNGAGTISFPSHLRVVEHDCGQRAACRHSQREVEVRFGKPPFRPAFAGSVAAVAPRPGSPGAALAPVGTAIQNPPPASQRRRPVNGVLGVAGRPMLRRCVSSAGPAAGLRRSSRGSR